jgi:PAS domain S-box-containing protein
MAFFNKRKKALQAALEKLKAAENRVTELEANFQAIERSVAVFGLTRDGIIVTVSDVVLDMLGHQSHQLIGKHHRVLCESDYSGSEEYIIFWRELVTGHVKEGRFTNVDAEGQRVYVEARYLPVLNDKGIVSQIIALVNKAPVP